MNKIYLIIGFFLCQLSLSAQVTVGDTDASQNFSVLEVSTKNVPGGLRLPQLTTAQRNALSADSTFVAEKNRGSGSTLGLAPGLTIYNTTIGCMEYWDGFRWVNMCYNSNNNGDVTTIPTGTGSFTGKTFFDIAYSNDNVKGCTYVATRALQKTNFLNQNRQDPAIAVISAPYSGVQVYTFVPTGSVSKVRFEYVDVTGKIIDQFVPDVDYSNLTDIITPCKATAYYKLDLDTDLRGLTRNTALKADLYVVYNDNAQGTGSERKLKLQVTLQDCMNCGAKTTNGGWLNFMCQNLGANNAINPFVYVPTTGGGDGTNGSQGYLYQWGRPAVIGNTDTGYQRRNSPMTVSLTTPSTNTLGTLPAEVYGRFITHADWIAVTDDALWGNGSQDIDPPKAVNDPCPAGWKVPSAKQWQSIHSTTTEPNTWTWTGNGYMVGDNLYLPLTGYRYNTDQGGTPGSMVSLTSGFYWTSTITVPPIATPRAMMLGFTQTNISALTYFGQRGIGVAVRCVEEDMRGVCVLPVITGTSTQHQNSSLFTSKFFTVTATGDDLTYQWYEGTVIGTGNPIGGATNATFSYSPTSVGVVTFYCEVTASTCTTPVASILFTITTP